MLISKILKNTFLFKTNTYKTSFKTHIIYFNQVKVYKNIFYTHKTHCCSVEKNIKFV